MCDRLEPIKVIIVGRVPDELKTDVEIVNYMTRNQRINNRMKGWLFMGTSTSRYVRKKNVTKEQQKRNYNNLKKLDKLNNLKKK